MVPSAGGDPLTYQWRKNGVNIPTATSSTYTITGASGADAANYDVVITGISGCTTANSSVAILTVNPTPTATISGGTTVCLNGSFPNIVFTNPQTLPVTITYNINGSGATTVNVPASSTANVAAPTSATGVFNYNLVSVAYQAAPACSNSITGTATVIVNPAPTASISGTTTVCQGSASPLITFTNPQPQAVTITYNINGAGTTTINVAASTTATLPAPTGAGGVFNYNLVSIAYQSGPGCSNTITGTATVTVNPTPTATISGTIQVCQGSPAPLVTFTNPQASAVTITYNINGVGTTTINVAASSTATVAAPTGTAGPFAYNLVSVAYQSAPGCSNSITGTATITVKPTPTVSATNTTQTRCSGVAIATVTITNPNAVPGTTFSWTRDNGTISTGNLTGIAASGTGTTISGTLTNTTSIQQITTFTITASAGGCPSITTTVIITVNPTPVMTSAASAIVCNTATVSIPLTSTVASTYTWQATPNGNVTGESTTLQTTSTLSNTLTNTSATPPFTGLTPRQNVTYTVIPTATAAAGGCAGTPQSVVVTVYPPYNISFFEYPTDQNVTTICDGVLVGGGGQNDMDLIEGQYSGSTLLWQYSIGSNTGPWSTIPGPHVNNQVNGIHDTLPDPPSVFSPIGTYYFRLLVDGCTSDVISIIKTSTLTVTAGGPNTVCESGAPAAIPLTGANVSGTATTTVGGSWSITSLNPTNGPAQGTLSSTAFITSASGNIPNVTYTPPANYSGDVTLTLTSNDPDGNGNCVPLTKTRVITVSQAPIISNPLAMSICSGSNTNITLASAIPSTYTWTLGAITGGITGASGPGFRQPDQPGID